MRPVWPALLALLAFGACVTAPRGADVVVPGGTLDLGLVIERADGSVLVVDTSERRAHCRIEGLGDLSHASAVFGRDGRFGYVFGRDGGLSKVDLLGCTLVKRVVQGGNAIGGAISQDGRLIAVSNYVPGGFRFFSADDLSLVADLPAVGADGRSSKTVGLVDAAGGLFVGALFDLNEIWVMDARDPAAIAVQRLPSGPAPYDGNGVMGGRWYLAGLFGEDAIDIVDLWATPPSIRRLALGSRALAERLPVYKMPHFEGIAEAGGRLFMPAVGSHEVVVVDPRSWQVETRIAVAGQPIFTVARPDGREIWVNFALPDNQHLQVIDVPTLSVVRHWQPGPGVLHLEFTPRGEEAWVSVRDADVVIVYDTATGAEKARIPAKAPSGILFATRAARIGQ
jgi:protein NirF